MRTLNRCLTVLAFGICASASVHAAIVWDQSPDALGGSMFPGFWTNEADGQNFADMVLFSSNVAVEGMDIYTLDSLVSIGDGVRIRIRQGAADGALIAEFDEFIDIEDAEGAVSATIAGTVRVHATFTSQVTLLANTTYWVGMSGIVPPYSNINQALGNGSGPLTDGMAAQYTGTTFFGDNTNGDMLFRLDGTIVPVPATLPLMASALGLIGIGFSRRKVH